MSLYAKYIAEREDISLIELDHGYLTYKKLNPDVYYILDVFVEREHRRSGIMKEMEDIVRDIALEDGAKYLQGSVCLSTNNVTQSMHMLLNMGYKYLNANGNMLYFIKNIEV